MARRCINPLVSAARLLIGVTDPRLQSAPTQRRSELSFVGWLVGPLTDRLPAVRETATHPRQLLLGVMDLVAAALAPDGDEAGLAAGSNGACERLAPSTVCGRLGSVSMERGLVLVAISRASFARSLMARPREHKRRMSN
jgi:hypothetical protein